MPFSGLSWVFSFFSFFHFYSCHWGDLAVSVFADVFRECAREVGRRMWGAGMGMRWCVLGWW
jgi:hypothetical protein